VRAIREGAGELLEAIGYAYPILALQLIVLLLERSGPAAIAAALALFFSLAHLIALFGQSSRLRLLRAAQLLERIPNSHLDIVDPDRIGAVDFTDLKNLTIVVVRPGGGDAPLGSPVSFYAFFGRAYIFLHDGLDEMSAYDRFALYHEVAHASALARRDLIVEVARYAWVCQLTWICLFARWNYRTAATLGLLIVAQAVFRYGWSLWPERFSTLILRSEVIADRLALRQLTPPDLRKVRSDVVDAPRLDPGLIANPPHRGNEFRNFMLLREIDRLLKTGKAHAPTPIGELSEGTVLKNVLTLVAIALLGQSLEPWRLWAALAMVALLTLAGRALVRGAFRIDHWCHRAILKRSTPVNASAGPSPA
jgi:hypothetical protein